MPGRSALAPAAAVVVIATLGAMVASGVFGGNDSSPEVDTGLVQPRVLSSVPEGEAASVVNDLRDAADRARRQRLAETNATAPPPPAPTQTTPPEDAAPAAETAPPASGAGGQGETLTDETTP
jgi:hypothetical protein